MDSQNVTLLLDQEDAYAFSQKLLDTRPRRLAVDAEDAHAMNHEEFYVVLNAVRAHAEDRFSNLHAGDRFAPKALLGMSSLAVMYDDDRMVLDGFEATVTMRYMRHGVTYLRFADGSIMGSELLIVSNWDAFN